MTPQALRNLEMQKAEAKRHIERKMKDPTRAYVGTNYTGDFGKGSSHGSDDR